MSEPYNEPLSILQKETVGLTSAYHHRELSDDELTVAIGEELEKAQQAVKDSIERAMPAEYSPENTFYEGGWNDATTKYKANLLKELSIDNAQASEENN